MTEAKLTWSIWQALLKTFAWAFTCRGFHRFAEWITAMALNVEEHTITQSVLALEQPAAWKALESFAEYGSWHADRVTWGLTRLIESAPGRVWHGYRVSAVDDKVYLRYSPEGRSIKGTAILPPEAIIDQGRHVNWELAQFVAASVDCEITTHRNSQAYVIYWTTPVL